MIIWLDFNVPHAMDKARMADLIAFVKHALGRSPAKSIAMLWMPDVPKENASLDDEATSIITVLKAAKLSVSDMVICLIKPGNDRENMGNAAWYTCGRLVSLAVDDQENAFLAKSSLAHQKRFRSEMPLPLPEDLLIVQGGEGAEPWRTDDVHMDKAFKAAQKGDKVAQSQIEGLMDKMVLGPKDSIVFVDILPHSGDRAKGVKNIARHPSARDQWHYLGVAAGPAAKSIDFPQKRMAMEFGKDFLNGAMEFQSTDEHGKTIAVRPNPKVPEPTVRDLRECPGALQAWEGLAKAEWKAVTQAGSQLVIQSKWEAEFAQAPPAVHESFLELKTRHVNEYQSVLTHLCQPGTGNGSSMPDARGEGEGEAEVPLDGRTDELAMPLQLETQEYDSKAALPKLVVDCRSLEKGVMIFRDEKFNTYLMSTTDKNHTCPHSPGRFWVWNVVSARLNHSTGYLLQLAQGR